ncbi:MAG TPA: CHAT domain-containing protein, partial [Polyangia bacterium]
MTVDYTGCKLVRRGPICVLNETRTLRLFATTSGDDVYAVIDGRRVEAREGRLAPRTGFALSIPTGASRLEIRSGSAVFQLRFTEDRDDPRLASADALRTSGKLESATKVLEELLPKLDGEDRDRALAQLARIAIARGDDQAAERGLRVAYRSAQATGRISDAVRDLGALLHVLLSNNRDPAIARAALNEAGELIAEYSEGRALVRYYEGLMAVAAADLRAGLAAFHECIALSRRLGNSERRHLAEQEVAKALAWLGRPDEGLRIQRDIVAEARAGKDTACNRAGFAVTLSWLALLQRPLAGVRARTTNEDLTSHFEAADRALEHCPEPFIRRHALINQALYALEDGGTAALAQERLLALRRLHGGSTSELRVWEKEIEARLHFTARKYRQALNAFDEQLMLARGSGFSEGRMRAEVGRGRALLALGRSRAALDSFSAAEQTLATLLETVPFAEGRTEFLGLRDDGVRHLETTLAAVGRNDDAFRVARLARAQALRGAASAQALYSLAPAQRAVFERAIADYRKRRTELEAEAADDWALSHRQLALRLAEREASQRELRGFLDTAFRSLGSPLRANKALALPGPGELQILYFPGTDRWLGFAATQKRLTVRSLPALDLTAANDTTLATALLEPFATELTAAKRVRFLASGSLQSIDLHALPFRGSPLLTQVEVEYGMDLSPATPSTVSPGAVLVVGNPTDDLRNAEDEAERVASLIVGRNIHRLAGAEATRERVLALLPTTKLFHFAGHGVFGGADGLESALMLAGGARLSAADVLALPRAPALVVLAACEAARALMSTAGDGLGLAQAFLAAGTSAVVAPTRPLRDDSARQLFSAFYAEYFGRDQLDPTRAL